MSKRFTILTLKQFPSGPLEPGEAVRHTWKLLKDGEGYKVLISQSGECRPERKTVSICRKEAENWLKRLSEVTVSLMPTVPGSCDGNYYTYKFYGNQVGLELDWYNDPPAGAQLLGDFTEWLWALVPDGWDITGNPPRLEDEL